MLRIPTWKCDADTGCGDEFVLNVLLPTFMAFRTDFVTIVVSDRVMTCEDVDFVRRKRMFNS